MKPFARGFHARPLLQFKRSELQAYANEHALSWHDDSSNSETRYDRNYLRHKVLPVIEERWPAYRDTISRMIKYQNECKSLLDEIADTDLKLALYKDTMCLNLDVVLTLSVIRQKNLIFSWINNLQLDSPGSRQMAQIISDLVCATADKAPCVNWNDVEIRRYKNLLYASNSLSKHNANLEYDWELENTLTIGDETLIAKPENGKGISKVNTKNARFVVRYRQGGEKIQAVNQEHSKTVKQLFQERGVLPWLRDRIPLIYIDDKLAVIPGFCVDKKYSATKDEPSWDIQWSGYDKVIQS